MLLEIFVLIIPLIFWNFTANFFATPKLFFLAILTLFLAGQVIFSLLKTKTISIPRNSSLILYGLVIASVLLNFILIPEGRPEALAGRGGLLLLLPFMSLLISFLPRTKNYLVTSFFILVSLLSLHTLLQLTWLYQASFAPTVIQSRSFTPTGSFLTTLILLLSGLFAALAALRSRTTRIPYLVVIFLTTISSVAIISLMLPGSPLALNLLPFPATWSVTLDALKSWRTAFLGVGIANYAPFFSSVKPLALNATNLWNMLPQSSSSELLTLLTTGGLALFLPFILLLINGIRHSIGSPTPLNIIFLALVLGFVFAPANLVLYFLLFLFLPYVLPQPTHSLSPPPTIRLTILLIVILPLLTLLYYLSRPILADYSLRRAQLAALTNDGKSVYEAQLSAIRSYPGLTSSRLAYADTNLRLAIALSQKTDLSEADRTNISKLIQQSIREAKAATSLRPNSSITWLSLGSIYRQLINVAEGADQFAVSAYAQAVALDPANPNLRVDFGGLLIQLGTNYSPRAETELITAIQLKPDYANAYYNLAKLYENEKDYTKSLEAMKKVATLLPADAPDYATVQQAVETLKQQIPAPPATSSAELLNPSPLPSPLPGGPVELNEN